MSSLHSNRSNRSCQNRVHNTHIAQHLRRASILESRKARLADRAAYAEKVRLRAQEVKATPRMSRIEDKAIAAQQAREQYLAQVAASCAEEVKRAKKIAEEIREKRAMEHAKLRDEMNERHANAEKRRLQYQQNLKRHRALSQVANESKKPLQAQQSLGETSASRIIQRAWRTYRRRKILSDFFELNLDLAHVQSMPFQEVSEMLSQQRIIARTGRVMKLCGLQDVIGGPAGENTAIRTFLSAFLILGHPEYVLSHNGDREEELMDRAKVLLMQFERVISKPPTEANFSLTSGMIVSISEAFSDFQLAFTAWKNHDSDMFVETMLAQFAELDAIWQTVKNDSSGNVAADYKEGIRYNQTVILARLKRLAGPEKAMKLINEAIKARRRSKAHKKPVGDIKPRSTANQQAGSIALEETSTHAESEATASNATSRLVPSNELSKVISPLPDNRHVVHELAINREYRIDVDNTSEARSQANRAVFDAMRKDVLRGMGNDWIVAMAEIIREKLLRTIPNGKPLYIQVSEGLDIELIKSQLIQGSFSYEKFFTFMNNLLPKLVSPARDPLVKVFVADASDDYVERLAKLMHIIDLLSLDYSNYLLMVSAPELLKHSVSYEQQCFQKLIGNGKLTKTLRWWRIARDRTVADILARSSEMRTPNPSPQRIYTTGLVDLFINLSPLDGAQIPEVLELDQARIQRVRIEILRMITISSIILTAKNLLKRDVRVRWKAQAQRMWDLPEATAYIDPAPYLSILESSQALPPSTKNALSGTVDRVLADAKASPAITHPVMKVLLQKIKSHVLVRLTATSSEERVRSAASATDVLSSGGLPECVGRIGSIVEEMGKLKQVDWEAHGKWLDEVAREVTETSRT